MKRSALWFAVAALLVLVALLLFVSNRQAPGPDTPASSASATPPHRTYPSEGTFAASPAKPRQEPSKTDERLKRIWETGTYENNLMRHQLEPFDAERLRHLVSDPVNVNIEACSLILRAAAEKDARFQDLLKREDLRKELPVDMALSAYDYSVNGNRKALDHILEAHRAAGRENGGWGSAATWALSYVDEWNLTKEALGSHVMSGDGAGADERYAFWLIRRYYFPNNREFPTDYTRFTEDLIRAQRESTEKSE